MKLYAPAPRPSSGQPSAPGARIKNAMTCDVEDYFQVSAFAPYIDRDSWPSRECRVEANMERILAIYERHGVKATFFTLGWIAERYPAMVRKIVAAGHELASHGYGHLRASDQDRAQFDNDIRSSKALLEDIGGQAVLGYRAPSFSIGHANLWALEALQEAGYRYSSSIYPIAHDHYGMPDAPRFAFYPHGPDGLLEVPVTTVNMLGRNLPAGGGGYFRLLPYALSRWMMQKVNREDRQPALFYFHPWELDPGQPRPAGLDAKSRFRHYVNIERMEGRLEQLARDFAWDRMDRIFLDSK
ncbi:XrtA system polysaccharide deacetylase [Massilia sp. LjRoot122]|uniref:XrtA system polysaccharide deacetylase n=1 Tax=Massilia sp. LjRoot122 TaxID=3342257 RepID=UPI003ED0280E